MKDPIGVWFKQIAMIWGAISVSGIFLKICVFWGLFTLISLGWQVIELLLYGELQPSDADMLIGLAFAFTAYKLMRAKNVF